MSASPSMAEERVRGGPAPQGFVLPASLPPVDVEAALRAVPASVFVKGGVIQALVDLCRARDNLPRDAAFGRRWFGFKDYPVSDYMRVAVLTAQTLWPELPLREGLRRAGREVFDAFMKTLSGRVLFGVLRKDVVAFIRVIGRAYELTQTHGRARIVEMSGTHCVLSYTGLYQFLDSLELGVIEAGAALCDHECEILVRHTEPGAGDLFVRLWPRPA